MLVPPTALISFTQALAALTLAGLASAMPSRKVRTSEEKVMMLKRSPGLSRPTRLRRALRACTILAPSIEPLVSQTKTTSLAATSRASILGSGATSNMK